jgi:hypothetical protein
MLREMMNHRCRGHVPGYLGGGNRVIKTKAQKGRLRRNYES